MIRSSIDTVQIPYKIPRNITDFTKKKPEALPKAPLGTSPWRPKYMVKPNFNLGKATLPNLPRRRLKAGKMPWKMNGPVLDDLNIEEMTV